MNKNDYHMIVIIVQFNFKTAIIKQLFWVSNLLKQFDNPSVLSDPRIKFIL